MFPFPGFVAPALSGNLVRLGLGLLLLTLALCGGFAWGQAHAARAALAAAASAADARLAAARRADQALLGDYLARLAAQTARSNALTVELEKSRAARAAATLHARQEISHALPQDPACDIPDALAGVLRAARQ